MKVVSDPKDGNYMQIPDYQKQIDELGSRPRRPVGGTVCDSEDFRQLAGDDERTCQVRRRGKQIPLASDSK